MWKLNKIPKIVHFYWGHEKLSLLRYLSVETFRTLNPDWEIKIHIPKVLGAIEKTWPTFEQSKVSITEDYFYKLKTLNVTIVEEDFSQDFTNDAHEVHKADFIRWKLLSTDGGLWSDIDIIYNNPMSQLLENVEENSNIDTILCPYQKLQGYQGIHTIGFILSSPNNQFFDEVYNIAKTVFNPTSYECIGSLLINKNFKTLDQLKSKFPFNNFLFLNEECVYSITFKTVNDFFNTLTDSTKNKINNKNCIGFHWYAGHPTSQEFETHLTEENLYSFNNLISTVYKNVKEKHIV